jgi:hypothetical protein
MDKYNMDNLTNDQMSNFLNQSIDTNLMPQRDRFPMKITRPGSDPVFATKVFLKSKSQINTNYSREQVKLEKEKKQAAEAVRLKNEF